MTKAVWAALIGILALTAAARADNYPSHPITIIVPFAAGGPSDAMARVLADRMRVTLGQPLVIENVTGAGGSIGVGRAVHSAPDGYTISFGHLGTHVANGAVYKLNYDLVTDLEPVVLLPSNPMIVVSKTDRVMLFNCATGLKYPLPPVTRTLDRHKPIDYTQF